MIHPIEYRYGSMEMKRIFDRNSWVKYCVIVEFAALEALVELGLIDIDKDVLKKFREKAVEEISYSLVKDLEKIYRHETMAVVQAIYRLVGPEIGRYLHLGLTSNDVLDNVLMLQVKDGLNVIIRKLDRLIEIVKDFVNEYKEVPVLGRTHGRAAVPITLGFRFLIYLDELIRCRLELAESLKKFIVGKVGGSVGSQVEIHPNGREIEEKTLEKLGLEPAPMYLQILPRDLLAHILSRLIILSSVLEHIANEIRILSRSGIEEVLEGSTEKQVGSSVMPHKRNPVTSEKVCGIARYLRSISSSVFENISFEDERDLRNSSFERIVIPEIFLLVDEQLVSLEKIFKSIEVYEEKCITNIKKEGLKIYSSVILHIATMKGGDRQKIHEKLMKIFRSDYSDIDELYKVIEKDAYLSSYISYEDLRRAADLNIYVNACRSKVERYLRRLE